MNCPQCGFNDSKVIDSRDVDDGIRRRRQCLECGFRFTTYERLQPASLFVIKKDERREEFRRDKLLSGVLKACEKRPLPTGTLEKMAEDIETELFSTGKTEIPVAVIGDMVMERLRELDHIAYIRFASVYRDFADITELKEVVDSLAGSPSGIQSSAQLSLLPGDSLSDLVGVRRKRGRHSRTGRNQVRS